MSIRVLLVDDEPDVRLVLAAMFAARDEWEVVGEAADGSQVLDAVARLNPDVVLLDLAMETPGDAVVPGIIRSAPECMVTVFSALPAADHRDRLLRLGAFSYVEKGELRSLPDLLEADYAEFRKALGGEDVIPRWVRGTVAS